MLVPVNVNSSVIKAIWWDDERSLLAIRVRRQLIVYRNPEQDAVQRIAGAASPGLMLNHLTNNGLPRPESRLSPVWIRTWFDLLFR